MTTGVALIAAVVAARPAARVTVGVARQRLTVNRLAVVVVGGVRAGCAVFASAAPAAAKALTMTVALAVTMATAKAARATAGRTGRFAVEQLGRRAPGLQAFDHAHRNGLRGVVLDAADHGHVAALGQCDGTA